MSWSLDDIKKKLQNNPDWEPSDDEIDGDSDFWTKFDEAMDSIQGASSSNDDDDDDDNFDWDDDDDGEDW